MPTKKLRSGKLRSQSLTPILCRRRRCHVSHTGLIPTFQAGPAMTRLYRPLSSVEDDLIRAYWPQTRYSIAEIGRMFGRSEKVIGKRARMLGLPNRKSLRKGAEKARVERQRRVTALPSLPSPEPTAEPARPTPQGWADGWSISSPTMAQLMSGR